MTITRKMRHAPPFCRSKSQARRSYTLSLARKISTPILSTPAFNLVRHLETEAAIFSTLNTIDKRRRTRESKRKYGHTPSASRGARGLDSGSAWSSITYARASTTFMRVLARHVPCVTGKREVRAAAVCHEYGVAFAVYAWAVAHRPRPHFHYQHRSRTRTLRLWGGK